MSLGDKATFRTESLWKRISCIAPEQLDHARVCRVSHAFCEPHMYTGSACSLRLDRASILRQSSSHEGMEKTRQKTHLCRGIVPFKSSFHKQ